MIVGNMTERPACRDASLWRGYEAGTISLKEKSGSAYNNRQKNITKHEIE